ncbi:MAG: hypothetical protein IKU52_06605 [Clostridia bacterium]|nr:hypothetical protein [Clostridia bacterium]
MKKFNKFLAILFCVALLFPCFVFAGPGGVAQNPDITMPKSSPVIDGTIEDNGIWSLSADHNEDTVGYYWASRPMTHSAKMYFAYDETYLYFAADITDNDAQSGLIYSKSASYDLEYGWTGDVITLMLDPLCKFERSAYQDTPRYNIGIFSNGGVGVFRTMVNPSKVNDAKTAGVVTATGWRFEAALPWSVILNDMKSISGNALSPALTELYAKDAVSHASVIYMDRYTTSDGTIDTWGRFITVCEETYDSMKGVETNGTDAKGFGLVLVNGASPDHFFGEWTVITEATCTLEGLREHTCTECGITVSEVIPVTDHEYGKWKVVVAATDGKSGSKMRTCYGCGTAQYKTIPAHGDSIVVAYYNASVSPADYEFENIDVINFHPASVKADAPSNPASGEIVSHGFTPVLASTRKIAEEQNPDIKFLFTVANANLTTFESWFGSKTYASKLAAEMTKIIKDNGFDGFDIDYEFPSGSSTYKTNFVYFMKCMRENLDALSSETGKEYFLSMAVPGGSWAFSLFDISSLSEHVDYFNIMNYDLYINNAKTHHHTPPYNNSLAGAVGGSVNADIQLYLSRGIPAEKIVPGCGMYSIRWKDVASTNNGLYQTGTRDYTNIHYTEIKNSYVNKNGYVRYWDENAQAPYLYNASEKIFISYDDEQSVEVKCKLVSEAGVRGLMVFDYCTTDGIGLFDNMREWLDEYSAHPCKDIGHTYGEWFVYREPTYREEGEKRSQCIRCDAHYSEAIPKLTGTLTAPTVTCSGNSFKVTEAANIESILYIKGNYTSAEDMRAAGAVEIFAQEIAENTANNIFTEIISDNADYTVCVVMIDTNEYFNYITIQGNKTKVSVDGIKISMTNLSDIKDIFIAKGHYTVYGDVNKNKTVRITAERVGTATEYSYSVNAGGEHTVLVRHNDGSMEFLYVEINVTEPTFSINGLQLTIGNLEGIKVIRTAYGTHTSASSIKKTEGARAFTARYIPDKTSYMIQYRQNGTVTVAVCYENGFSVFYTYEVVQKVPTFVQEGNVFTIGNVDDLKVVRYAKGEYTTSSQIKNAAGSVAMTEKHISNGVIKVRIQTAGVYTFCVQYKDDSYNYYTVTVE